VRTCRGCGGLLGRDCFNEDDCVWIMADMRMREAQDAQLYREVEREHYEALEREHFRAQEEDFDAARLEATGMGLS